MSESNEQVKEQVDQALSDLQTMADEIRVKIHLASMDAKDAWTRLEPRLRDFEQKAEKAAAVTGRELKEVGLDLKERFHKLREELK